MFSTKKPLLIYLFNMILDVFQSSYAVFLEHGFTLYFCTLFTRCLPLLVSGGLFPRGYWGGLFFHGYEFFSVKKFAYVLNVLFFSRNWRDVLTIIFHFLFELFCTFLKTIYPLSHFLCQQMLLISHQGPFSWIVWLPFCTFG